jgi:hypothetical protein
VVSARGDLVRRFSTRAAVGEEIPIRAFDLDLGGPAAFVVAVVPFEQIAIDFGDSAEAGQVARPRGPL